MRPLRFHFAALTLLVALAAPTAFASRDEKALARGRSLLEEFDGRRRLLGSLKSVYVMLETRQQAKVGRELVVYAAPEKRALTVLFTKPKMDAGSGYLRLQQNLWSYDTNTGRWERRTEREEIGGTNIRRSDLDVARLAEEYDVVDFATESISGQKIHCLTLQAKKGIDVAYPRRKFWVDESLNEVKAQEFAASGKLLRTSVVTKLTKVKHKESGKEVGFPKELRFIDEVDRGRITVLTLQAIEVGEVAPEVFTKGWLESKSR